MQGTSKFSFRSLRRVYRRELLVKFSLFACAQLSVLVTIAIIGVLLFEAARFFRADEVTCECGNVLVAEQPLDGQEQECSQCGVVHEMPARVTFIGFITGGEWDPLISQERKFGVWALISGTLWVAGIAMIVALPLGLVTAIYLSEYAHTKVRATLKPALEILAGIPTVVYGVFALTIITPSLRWFDSDFGVFNVMSAGIAVGILCLPIICSLCEDALRAVPRSLREGAYGLGGTKFDVSTKVVVPAALSGIISAFLLAVSRAVGETMIVAMVAGSLAQFTLDPREPSQTMTGWMVQMALGDVSNFDLAYLSLYAVALVLFVITFGLTVSGNIVRSRFREEYE